jgi:hypothetical protein
LNGNNVRGVIQLLKQLALDVDCQDDDTHATDVNDVNTISKIKGPTKKVQTSYYKTQNQTVGKKHKVKIKIQLKHVARSPPEFSIMPHRKPMKKKRRLVSSLRKVNVASQQKQSHLLPLSLPCVPNL